MTTYTKTQRKEIYKQLVAAKTHLVKEFPYTWEGNSDKSEYICFAVDIAMGHSPGRGGTYSAKEVIMDRLGGYATVNGWLCKNISGFEYATMDDIQAYRHRWLDALIEEFKD